MRARRFQPTRPHVLDQHTDCMGSRFQDTTALIVMYRDSDGWYDHRVGPIANPSTAIRPNASMMTMHSARAVAALLVNAQTGQPTPH